MRVRHNRNANTRGIYFVILFVVYRFLFSYFDFSLNLAMYGMFGILLLSYYLLGSINFNEKYRRRNIISSIAINFFVFSIFYFFLKNEKIYLVYIIYTIFQLFFNYLLHSKQENKINTLVVDGLGNNLFAIQESLKELEKFNYIGYLSENVDNNRLGSLNHLLEVIEKNNVEYIIFTKDEEMKKISNELMECKLRGIKVLDYLGFLEEVEGKIDVDKIDSLWFVMSNGFDGLSNNFQKRLKRIFDFVVAILLFTCSSPFMFFTYFLVKLDIGVKYIILNPYEILKNPAFFRQKRIGYMGKEFEIIKFRSMKIHNPNEYSKYAGEKDERITKIGNFIRKTRLDELPQIINVLRGDMSFIGPRPEWDILGRDYEKKINNYKLRYSVCPGLTGWAQVLYPYGASVEDAKRKLEYDLYYIKYQNFYLDLIIMFKTIQIVIFGKGR